MNLNTKILVAVLVSILSSQIYSQTLQEIMDRSKETEKVAKEYIKLYFSFEHEKIKEFYTEESTWFDPTAVNVFSAKKQIGTEAILKNFESWGDMSPAEFDIVHEYHFDYYAFFSGTINFSWTSEEGKTYDYKDVPISSIVKVENGKVTEHIDYGDYSPMFKEWK